MGERKGNRSREHKGKATSRDQPTIGPEHARIAQWLGQVRFRKKFFGGVRERDVWKKFGELDAMYSQALFAERVRYDTLLEQQRQSAFPGQSTSPDPKEERE